MTEWREEHCSSRPDTLQAIAPNLYMERRNIREAHHAADEAAGMPAYTEWVCESREITKDEHLMLESIREIEANKAVDAYTLRLMEMGVL